MMAGMLAICVKVNNPKNMQTIEEFKTAVQMTAVVVPTKNSSGKPFSGIFI
jgi:hypothetical protein